MSKGKGRRSKKSLFGKHGFIISVVCAIVFLLVVVVFQERITKFLKDKQDFDIGHKYKSAVDSGKVIKKKNETKCREIFERLIGKPFPSVRPAFLKRSNGYALELDGYNDELKLAFEYNGRQHYYFVRRFHKTEEDLKQQKIRDVHKYQMCARVGVRIITIPYTIKYEELESFIRMKLKELKVI